MGAPNFIPGVAETLRMVMGRLADNPEPDDAVLFLHSLARLESYPADVLKEAGADELVREAAALRNANDRIGLLVSSNVHPSALVRMAESVSRGEVEAVHWANAVLLFASIAPWLTPSKRAEAEAAIFTCVETLRRTPDAFRKGAEFAVVRSTHEAVPRLAVDFITALSAIPETDFAN